MKISKPLILALSILFASNVTAAKQASFQKSHEDASQQIKFVNTLLEVSSAAQKVKASKDANVQTFYRAAKELYKNAQKYMAAGDNDAASESLYHSTVMMFQTAKLAEKKQAEDNSDKLILEARLKSVDALMDAMQRISKEKNLQAKTNKITANANMEIEHAIAMMEKGEVEDARKVVDMVYVNIKTAINEMRSGDTLVRSLHFDTPKDEYLYEVDRNETHSMLVMMFLKEKMQDPETMSRVQKFLDRAEQARKTAEAFAQKGDYEQAVKNYEESTGQIIKAIRSAGFYIPG